MQFVSTRNNKELISFSQAITQCLGSDGGLYVPAYAENLAPWIYYLSETTSFSSLAGALTSALIKEERVLNIHFLCRINMLLYLVFLMGKLEPVLPRQCGEKPG